MTDFVYDVLVANGDEFVSSAFHGVAYNRENKQMWVEFTSGGTYIYEGVEESTFNLFVQDESLGGFWRDHISGKYDNNGDVEVNLVKRVPVEVEPVSENTDTASHETPGDSTEGARDRRYSVKWTNGAYTFEPQYYAMGENDAIVQWNAALSMYGITDAQIVSVTRYF